MGDGEVYRRRIRVSGANPALAESLAEFTFGLIVLSTRHLWRKVDELRRLGASPSRMTGPGNYRSTIGLAGCVAIARALLRHLQVRVLVHDPYLDPVEAGEQEVERCNLRRLFAESDVVSCHLPSLPESRAMITGELLRSMKPGATFVNTARGAVMDESARVAALADRPDLGAVLDVGVNECKPPGSALLTLPNVIVTRLIAGCLAVECHRLGHCAMSEVRCWQAGEPARSEEPLEQFVIRARCERV